MISFLELVAIDLIKNTSQLENLVIITPNKRSSIYLKKYLIKYLKKSTFLPKMETIEDFIFQISNLKPLENTDLLFSFYEVYTKIQNQPDDFLTFSQWAKTLLQDFNEIDQFLINENDIFPYIKALKSINHWSFNAKQTKLQKNYLKFWELIGVYYKYLKKYLLTKKQVYQGLAYREAVNKTTSFLKKHNNKNFAFVGFNALNKAEEFLFQEFLNYGNSDAYWDIDAHFLNDYNHEAGFFIRKYKNEWSYYKTNDFKWISYTYQEKKNIHIISTQRNVSQAQYAAQLLEKKPTHTAVILGNEMLATPFINTLTESTPPVNLSKGKPLSAFTIASFLKNYLKLYEQTKPWHYKDFLDILNNPCTPILYPHYQKLIDFILDKNISFIFPKTIKKIHPEFRWFTVNFEDISTHSLIKNISDLIDIFDKNISQEDHESHTCIYLLKKIIYRLENIVEKKTFINNSKTLGFIFNLLLEGESLLFENLKENSTQVLGFLESRSLDFKNVILTSLNEGIIPSGRSFNSYIPYEVKKTLGMTTYEERNAIYSYHFYRLLQRAKNIYLIYNDSTGSLSSGDKSRFIWQLEEEHLSNHSLKYEVIIAKPKKELPKSSLKIIKDKHFIDTLKSHAEIGFSPSALATYIRNPVDFYTKYILKIKESKNIEETLAANTKGTIIHNTLETLYKPFEGKTITPKIIDAFKKNVEPIVQSKFKAFGNYRKGKNHIIYHIILAYLDNFLDQEKKIVSNHKVKILHIEIDLKNIHLEHPNLNFKTLLRGKIDRIDEIDGNVRILDYKSGKVEPRSLKLDEMSMICTEEKYSKAFQMLVYTLIIRKSNILNTQNVQAGILSFKNLHQGFMPFKYKNQNFITYDILTCFEKELITLINAIGNIEIPIEEKNIATPIDFINLF